MKKILIVGGSFFSGNRGVNALTRSAVDILLDMYKDDISIKILSYCVREEAIVRIQHTEKNIFITEVPFKLKDNLIVCAQSVLFKAFKGFVSNIRKKSEAHVPLFSIRKKVKVRFPLFIDSFKNSKKLLELFKDVDVVLDISAGDSFTDIYGFKRFLMISLPKISTINIDKELVLLPQTIGPFNGMITKLVSKYIVRNTALNYVRDRISYKFLIEELRAKENNSRYSPDMAFYMTPKKDVLFTEAINSKTFKGNGEIVGINISALMYNEGYNGKNQFSLVTNYKDLVHKIISYFIDKRANIVLIPHVISELNVIEDDFRLCQSIYEEYRKDYPNIYTLSKPFREDEIKNIIGCCDFFVGSRMHACIGAISMGVPTVPIAYSRKFIGIWEEYGLESCVADPRVMDEIQIIKIINFCYLNKSSLKMEIVEKLSNVKCEIRNCLNDLVSLT